MEPYIELEHRLTDWLNGLPGSHGDLTPDRIVSCASGSAALLLAVQVLDQNRCSSLAARSRLCAIPNYTMIACPRAAVLGGLAPVLVDCDARLLMDLDLLDEACAAEDRISTVMPVHVYGRRLDMDALHALAGKYGLAVVEDLAEAHGVAPHPRTDAACWSFFRNKIVRGEEGGAVAFRDPKHAARARQLRNMGFTEAHDYRHVSGGWNHRMSNAHAGLILDSLKDIQREVVARKRVEGRYDAECPPAWRMANRDAVWVYDVRVPGLTRKTMGRIVGGLRDAGVQARYGFMPISRQEEFRTCKVFGGEVSRRAADEVFYLPADPAQVTEGVVRSTFETIGDMLNKCE